MAQSQTEEIHARFPLQLWNKIKERKGLREDAEVIELFVRNALEGPYCGKCHAPLACAQCCSGKPSGSACTAITIVSPDLLPPDHKDGQAGMPPSSIESKIGLLPGGCHSESEQPPLSESRGSHSQQSAESSFPLLEGSRPNAAVGDKHTPCQGCRKIITKWDNMTVEELNAELLRQVAKNVFGSREFCLFVKKYLTVYTGTCPVCQVSVRRKNQAFHKHLLSHMTKPKLVCAHCNLVFPTLGKRARHLYNMHARLKQLTAASGEKRTAAQVVADGTNAFEKATTAAQRSTDHHQGEDVDRAAVKGDPEGGLSFEGADEDFLGSIDSEEEEEESPSCGHDSEDTGSDGPSQRDTQALSTWIESTSAQSKKGGNRWDNMTVAELNQELLSFVTQSQYDSKDYTAFVTKFIQKAYNGSCPICGKDVRTTNYTFHRHLYLHMPNVQLKCGWCEETLSTPGQQYYHERKVHREPIQRLQASLDDKGREEAGLDGESFVTLQDSGGQPGDGGGSSSGELRLCAGAPPDGQSDDPQANEQSTASGNDANEAYDESIITSIPSCEASQEQVIKKTRKVSRSESNQSSSSTAANVVLWATGGAEQQHDVDQNETEDVASEKGEHRCPACCGDGEDVVGDEDDDDSGESMPGETYVASARRSLSMLEEPAHDAEHVTSTALLMAQCKKLPSRWDTMTVPELHQELLTFVENSQYDTREYTMFVTKYIQKAYKGNCPICDKKVRATRYTFHRHLCLHMPNVQLKCGWCEETFSTPGQQYWHVRKIHREPQQFLQAGGGENSARGAATMPRVAAGGDGGGHSEEERHSQQEKLKNSGKPAGDHGACGNANKQLGAGQMEGEDGVRVDEQSVASFEGMDCEFPASADFSQKYDAGSGGYGDEDDDDDYDDNSGGSGQWDTSVGNSQKSLSMLAQSWIKSVAVLQAQKPKIDLSKWNNMTVSQLNQQLFSYVSKSQYETKEYIFFLNTYLQKAYNGRCPMCNKAIKKKTYLLRRHLYQHMPSPQLKCGWCDEAFSSVHHRYWHERRVHRRPLLPQTTLTVGSGGGGIVDISDRRQLSALKVMCKGILAKWDQMGPQEMQAELLRIVKESAFEGEEFTLFLSKYVKDFYGGSCAICNKKVHKNTKNFGDHLFIHMPNAKASCHYCSMSFQSLSLRGIHMRAAHRERFKLRKRQRPDARCSGIQTAASPKNSDNVALTGPPLQLAVSSADGLQQEFKLELENSLDNIADSPNVGGESLGQSQADEESKASCLGDLEFPFLLNNKKRLEREEEMTQRLKMFIEQGDCESQEFMQFIVKYRQMFCGACPLCTVNLSRNMKDVNNFIRHLVTHMPNPNIKCTSCPLTFRSLAARETHIFKAHGGATGFVCELCGAGFHAKARFKAHSKLCRSVSYKCRHCPQQFTSRHFRFKHEKKDHGVLRREHICFCCGKVLNSPGELRNHMDTHTGYKKHQCNLCPKGFYSKQGLKYHMADHTSMPTRFSCDMCERQFRWKKDLNMHRQCHSASRPFPCQDCGKAFKERGQLKKHLRIHTGERPYPCPEPGCGRAFITSCKRKYHCQSVHGYPTTSTIKTEITATTDPESVPSLYSSFAMSDFQSDAGDMKSGEILQVVTQP